mmetsp:Transcript_50559/g.163828  ORF Transcript_50559/g.163828 Transcript_50559/m.163828 type:complete len:425 (+) Transcript_50559:73-1347(+)
MQLTPSLSIGSESNGCSPSLLAAISSEPHQGSPPRRPTAGAPRAPSVAHHRLEQRRDGEAGRAAPLEGRPPGGGGTGGGGRGCPAPRRGGTVHPCAASGEVELQLVGSHRGRPRQPEGEGCRRRHGRPARHHLLGRCRRRAGEGGERRQGGAEPSLRQVARERASDLERPPAPLARGGSLEGGRGVGVGGEGGELLCECGWQGLPARGVGPRLEELARARRPGLILAEGGEEGGVRALERRAGLGRAVRDVDRRGLEPAAAAANLCARLRGERLRGRKERGAAVVVVLSSPGWVRLQEVSLLLEVDALLGARPPRWRRSEASDRSDGREGVSGDAGDDGGEDASHRLPHLRGHVAQGLGVDASHPVDAHRRRQAQVYLRTAAQLLEADVPALRLAARVAPILGLYPSLAQLPPLFDPLPAVADG